MSDARIIERGYRRYDGERRGPRSAVRSLTVHGLRRVLGLRRPARTKALPGFVIVLAYLPAVIMIGLAVFIPADDLDLISYPDYYGFIVSAMLLFIAFVAPEALCPDRRHRTLGLYLASPLTRDSYLAAKIASVVSVLLLITFGPELLLLIASTLVDEGPAGVGGFLETLGRIAASGLLISCFLGMIASVISSFTERRAFASVGIIVTFIAGGIISGVLYDNGNGVDWAPALVPHIRLVLDAVLVVYGVGTQCAANDNGCTTREYGGLSPTVVVLSVVGWTLLATVVLRWRYRTLKVSG